MQTTISVIEFRLVCLSPFNFIFINVCSYECVCVCICVYVCTCAFVYVCMYACILACMYWLTYNTCIKPNSHLNAFNGDV